ncbi:PBECR2 nuclease fold domain-containing protein [Campylobacter upsaliensis]
MQFNFNFEAFEQSGKEKNEAINYLKSLNSSIDFDKLEQETKGDENAIYEALKGGNFSFSKPSIEQTRQKLLKNKENEALKAEFNAGLSWLGEEKKQNFNFYDFKKAKEKANSKLGLIQADLKAKEKELKRKEALFETRLKERGIIAKSFDDMLDQSGAYLGADLLEKGLNKLGFKDENYIFESEKEDIKSRALKSVREKLERGDLEFNEREKHALRSKYDELDYKKALEKEKERLRLSQKSGNFSEAEREFIENDLGFFNTLFNDDKENIKEFKEKVKSEGVISSEIIKAANTLKAFDEGNLFKNMLFADEKEKKEFQQNFLNDAYKIAELSGFDDVGLDKKGELYFIKDEQKYLVNTGFFDNFAQLLNDTKFEFAGGVLGGMKGFNSGKSAKGKVAKSILGAAAGSFGGAFLDAKIADMYLNRESDFKKNLDFAIQAGLLSMAGDGVILSVKPLAKRLYKGVKKGGEILGEYSILGTLKTLPQQNIQAAEKIIDEVFSPKMKEELKAAQEEFGGSVRGEDLKNAFFANLQKKFTQKYGENDSKTKSVAKIAEIFNTNSLKTRQQAMLDLVRSDTHGSTLAYLLEIAKDDVKIQSNLKNMLNLASSNVEKNLKNLNINAREIKHILDEFEAGNKAAFKEVESQISKLYDENYRVVLSKGEYENIKEEFRQNGVNLEEMTPFLRDLEANVFNENGVTFTQLNNFRKNLNFYIFNKDKTPNFINTLKKIGENILKNEIDKGIDNIFSQNKAAYESIKELYSTSLKDYATLKSLNESIKNLKLQDSAKSADEVLNSLIKYAKGQGEKGVNNLQKIKDYLGEENNAFLEMQILNKLFKESVVENDRASLRVFDSESFLGRVRELVGENELYERKIGKEFLEELSPSAMPKQISIDEFLNTLENFKNKENFLKHIEKDPKRKDYLNLIEPTLKEPDIAFKKLENGVEKEKFIKKFSDGKDFFYLLATKDNKETILTAFKTDKINTILKEFNTDIIPTFIRQGSKGKAAGTTNEGIITQPLFKSKEAREFLELVEGFHKLYKNDASIAKNLVQGTASQLSTSIATSAEGAIKQKVVKGGFDPIFRLLPDKILFGLFAKQIQGGALRYHLKKALSRSLNYDDFKIKLEKELKRTNFNSNTSRLIDEFMQNLDTFNAEKEAKLAKIREEQARIKEEEQARINAIKTAQENAYNAQEANLGNDILEPSSLKEDFGENFTGYKGKEAIEKLLEEQRGQVRGAFYKEGLGEIDLVWGDENFGLRHILEQRTKQWGEEKALKFISHLNENIEKGQIVEVQKGRAAIKTDLTTIILDKKENNNFVLTAFRDRNNKKELESLNLSQSKTFTSENAEANAKESPVTSLNQESIIAQKAKNDEVLEAEVIEEVGLNEPMKFLEFQQRKLLTYIKENTPLRLLEHKKELKTRDILNFLEQSALNGKQKVFLMRNLERDFTKLKEDFKELESQSFKRDLLDKTKPLRKAEKEELTSEVLEQVQKENLKLYLNDTSGNLTKFLNAKKPFKITMRGANIKHILNRHGENSTLAKNGQPFVNLEDIKKYDEIINNADRQILKENDKGEKTLLSGKQINGHYIVISSVRLKNGELKLKTMYKENGKLENDKAFKSVKLPSETPSVLRGQSLTTDLDGYPSHADESIAQNSQEAKIKEAVKNHNAIYKEILDNDYIFTDERSKIFRKRERELIENLAKDEKVQAFTSQWGYPFKKDGELHGVGLDYKAKVYGKGEHKMMRVSGGGFGSATQQKKQERLLELEKERLQEAFKADFGIDGFISKYVENGFFETLWRETSAYKGTDYGWGVQPREYYPYYENRIMPSDTITQAKEKLQKEKSSWSVKRQETKGSEDIIFTDKKGKEHTLTKETQKAWLEAFNLKSLDEAYIPNLPRELKEALGKEIKLTKGSLYKIVEKGREKYIPQMKQTLQNPDFALRDRDNMLILAKQIEDKQYFTSVNLETKDYFISVSNAPKKENILKNKVENGAEILYQSPNAKSIFYTDTLLQTDKSSANKIDEDIIAQNAKSERAEFESFKDKIKELYTKYEGLNPYDKSESQLRSKLLNEEIEPEIKKEFKSIIDKFKGADNKDKILRVIKENKEELSDYLAFHIALRKDIYIDGYGEGRYDFYDKSIRDFFKLRENKPGSEIYDDSNYRALAALENLSNKNTSLYFSFRDLNGKIGEFKTYPRIQDLLFYDLILGDDLKNAVILSTKDKHLKEKLIEKLKAYIDKKIYADFLEYKIKDLESRNPKNSHFENYKDEKWDEEALKSLQKELEDLRANEKAQKLEAKGSEDIIFTDKKGKEHTLTKETQKAWLEAFNLKSLEEAYIPNFKAEVKEAINRVLGGEEIKLTKGSFEKLLKRDREEFLPYIKDTLEKADLIIKDKENALIFVKDIGKKSYFTSVAKNANNEWVISTNSLKTLNTLKNRVDDNGEVLYLSKEAPNILAEAFTKRAFSNELAKDIIPQKPQQKALNLQEIEQSLKARKSQINDEISANDKAFKENLKEVSKVKPILEALKKEWEALEPTIVTWTHTDYSKAKPKKYYKRKPNLSNLWHIEETLDVYKGYARESDRHANQVAREIALLEKYVKLLKDKEAEVKAFKAKAEADENALILESRIIPIYNQLREAFKKGHHTTKQILEANNIKQDSVQAKEVIDSIAQTRQYLEDTFNIKPLEEFGTNYAEFYRDGKGAVEKLLAEKQGQVAGAFYKEGLGEIDLVWGDENFGLRHIIDKHGDEFEDIAAELDEIIAKGVLEKGEHRYFIKHNDYKGMIALDYKGKESNAWILTLYKDKSALNPAYQHQIKHNTNTSSETRANGEFENSNIKNANLQKEKVDKLFHGDAEVISAQGKFNELEALNLTDEDIIPQQKIKFAMEKFHYDEKKAKDLLEWHKNSHALTKDENGLPKVFYHGTYAKFEVFKRVGKASQQGFFFTPIQKATEQYGDTSLSTFLNIKNPFRADELKINSEADLQKWADILKLDYDKEKYESFKDLKTKLEKVKEATKKAGFEFHSASGGGVYVIDNKGRNSFINLEELDKENKRVVEAFKGLETEDIYFYYVVRNEFDLVLYVLNKNDRYFHTSGRDEVKKVLEKLGYDGVVLNDTIITVFNSNQIKHIDNKGSFTDTKGNVTSKKPKNKEAEFSYFNEKSDNIYHSNPHLGAGLVGGVLNGVEQDENGNLSFDPVKFAMGFLGGSGGSFALKKGFQILEKNPELKEKIINELADTLAQGFEKAREKYSLLNLLEPRYIVKNEKGRKIQAKTMLKELEREQNKNLQNIIRQNLQNLPLNNKPLELSEKQVKLLINRFANARNLKEHLNTRADNRKELYALLNDTLENPQIHFIKEGRDKYVKRYKGDVNEPYFYLLITQDKDKIFITHLKTRDIKYLSRQISNAEQIKKGADIIEALSQRAGDDKASASKKDYSK